MKILFLGNSITLHQKCAYWWDVRGMASSSLMNDYVHQVQSRLSQYGIDVNVKAFEFSAWEIMGYDRAECLGILDKFLKESWTCIVVQLGENAKDLTTLEADYIELLTHLKKNQYDVKLIVVGNFWNLPVSENMKRRAANQVGAAFVDLSDMWDNPFWVCPLGTTVQGDDRNFHKVEHEGVSKHPGDKGMTEIARRIVKEIRHDERIYNSEKRSSEVKTDTDWLEVNRYRQSEDYSTLAHVCMKALSEVKESIRDRRLIVWGCGVCGVAFLDVFEDAGLKCSFFTDTRFNEIGFFLGRKVISPSLLNPSEFFVIIAISSMVTEPDEFLIEHGFSECKDFVHILDVDSFVHDDLIYKGVPVGRMTYGYKNLLESYPMASRIGRYCSINSTARILNNHPIEYITTSPILDYRAFSPSYAEYMRRRGFCERYGRHFQNHKFEDSPLRDNRPVEIGNDVWIGANVIILPGVKIGDGAVLAAGAVVTHDVAPYAIVAGVPAKLIRKRFSEDMIVRLMRIAWWDWEPEKLQDNLELFYQPEKFVQRFSDEK